MKTKEKGDVALSHAIQYFMTNGYEVSLPIGDKRSYDLIVETGGMLSRVQVKCGGLYPGKSKCVVALHITGGNQSFHYSKKYKDDDFDLLFTYTAKGYKYLIPWRKVTARNEISIEHPKYQQYAVV